MLSGIVVFRWEVADAKMNMPESGSEERLGDEPRPEEIMLQGLS